MFAHVHRIGTAVLYQLTLTLAMVVLPLAVVSRRLGITLPMHRLLTRVRSMRRRASDSR